MNSVSTELLDAWIRLSTILKNKRYMVNLSFNEGVICHILYKELKDRNNRIGLSVKSLCEKTNLLKSQVHKIIIGLEEKKMVKRIKSEEDKRVVYVSLNENEIGIYKKEYNMVLKLIDNLVKNLGEEKSKSAAETFTLISDYVSTVQGR